tara:strand:+ start:445 stop:993 length:549 start_codon:yes stop_codon:yes gene_type:complete
MNQLDKNILALKEAREKSELFRLKEELLIEYEKLSKREDELAHQEEDFYKESVDDLKLVETHSQSMAAFFNSSLEKSKSLLALSVAGIGYIAGLANIKNDIDRIEIVLMVCSVVLFSLCGHFVVKIYENNSKYLANYLSKNVELRRSLAKNLGKLDRRSSFCFYGGVLFVLLLMVYKMISFW